MDLDKALQSCDQSKPVIFIAHRPQTAKLALESTYRVDLVLSGKGQKIARADPEGEKSQRYQANIQCWAIIGPPTKRHLNDVSLAGR